MTILSVDQWSTQHVFWSLLTLILECINHSVSCVERTQYFIPWLNCTPKNSLGQLLPQTIPKTTPSRMTPPRHFPTRLIPIRAISPFREVVLGMTAIGGSHSVTKGYHHGGWVSKELSPEIIWIRFVPLHVSKVLPIFFITKRQCFIQKTFSWGSSWVSYTSLNM